MVAPKAYSLYLQGLRTSWLALLHVYSLLGFIDTRLTYGLETAIPVAKPEDTLRRLCALSKEKRACFIHHLGASDGLIGYTKYDYAPHTL